MSLAQARTVAVVAGVTAALGAWTGGWAARVGAQDGPPPAGDVQNVRFRGDSTLYGMRIVDVQAADGAFVVRTTGARFEYRAGELRVFQGLEDPPRLLARITLSVRAAVTPREQTPDHVLFQAAPLNLGVYGDSTLVLAPAVKLDLRCSGDFKPEYQGEEQGELLLIDAGGGLEICPQRHEAGFEVRELSLDRRDWHAEYTLRPKQRVMLAAFPGRPFNWARSFRSNTIVVHGSMGKGVGNPYGEMPPDEVIDAMARNFQILMAFHLGLYADGSASPPYEVANAPEFRRLVARAHRDGMKVVMYASFFNSYRKVPSDEAFYNQVLALRKDFGVDGLYLDGLRFDYHWEPLEDKLANWEMVRRLRELFGTDGVLIFHGTHLGTPAATVPNIDTYCDATVYGENVPFNSVYDPYVRFQVRKYGISNTVAMWVYGKHPDSITPRDLVRAELAMNGRRLAYSEVAVFDPPPHNKYTWGDGMTDQHRDYLQRLADLQRAHLAERQEERR